MLVIEDFAPITVSSSLCLFGFDIQKIASAVSLNDGVLS